MASGWPSRVSELSAEPLGEKSGMELLTPGGQCEQIQYRRHC